ncbi:uncharacterized protein [Procambarus clarkii]
MGHRVGTKIVNWACGWVEKVQGHQLWNDAKVVMIHNYQMVARKMFVNSLGCDKVYRLRCRNLFIGEVMYDTLTLGEVMSDTLTLKIGSLGTSPSLRPYAVLCNAPCYVPNKLLNRPILLARVEDV